MPRRTRWPEGYAITRFWSLSAAGFAATAVGFGPARMGFGLFVPEFRAAFELSTSTVGIVSSLGFLGFLLGLLLAEWQLLRRGPALPVLTGLAAAAAGMATVALAPGLPVLAFGVFLAASSAGLAWTPFNDGIHRKIGPQDRAAALSTVSSGTGIGIALAGAASLVMVLGGLSWRLCWAGFAVAAALALLGNRAALRDVGKAPEEGTLRRWKELLGRAALPLYAVGLAYGTTSAIFIAFAADRMVTAGGVPGLPVRATPALVYICYGLFGLSGLLTAKAGALIGLPALLRLLLAAGALSLAFVALAPGSWAGLGLSAGLQGVHVMMTSAVLAFWSERLFPSLASLAFTAALLAAAAGNVAGPAAAGLLSDAVGPGAMFLGAAALPALTGALLRARHVQEGPAGPSRPDRE